MPYDIFKHKIMTKLIPFIVFFSLCLLNTSARCQHEHFKVIDHLCSSSDEILLVNIIEDKPDNWGSLSTCFSEVKAVVLETFKITRYSGTDEFKFRRMMYCGDTLSFTKGNLLQAGQPYIVFLRSGPPDLYDDIVGIQYQLSDYILGVQEPTDDLYSHLTWWHREEKKRLRKE